MTTYKMRAECLIDVVGEQGFLAMCRAASAPIFGYTITNTDGNFGDVHMVFRSDKTLRTIRKVISHVIDGHCMLRTVAHVDDYTGEQYYFEGE